MKDFSSKYLHNILMVINFVIPNSIPPKDPEAFLFFAHPLFFPKTSNTDPVNDRLSPFPFKTI